MQLDNIRHELAERTGYSSALKSLDFLARVNEVLVPLDKELQHDSPHERTDHAVYFIFGLYRSGTSLLYQVLASCLDVLYPDNLAARFWKAPQVGFMLSRLLELSPCASFNSDYGKTPGVEGPHEYSYFWRDRLEIDDEARQFDAPLLSDSGKALKACLCALMNRWGKSLLFKNVLGAHRMKELNSILEKTVWIYIERDMEDVAISHYHARIDYFGVLEKWWGLRPPGCADVSGLTPAQQIAKQVFLTAEYYAKTMQGKPNVIHIRYDDLCRSPTHTIQRVRALTASLYGIELPERMAAPDPFPIHRYDKSLPEYAELLSEVRSLCR